MGKGGGGRGEGGDNVPAIDEQFSFKSFRTKNLFC